MTFVITQPCIDVQDQSCVEVCPVDCIHYDEGADRMLFIEPAVCIDCGACEPVCPVTAIFDEPDVPDDQQQFTEINELWFTDAAASRARVADIPALEEALATAAGSGSAAAETETPSAAAMVEPAAPSRGLYKYGEAGIEGKCALCGTYVIKGGTMFREKSVLCPDCTPKAERMNDPFHQRAGSR